MKFIQKGIINLLLRKKEVLNSKNKSTEKFQPEKIKRVLLISCTAIGDTIFAVPAIRAIKNLLPNGEVFDLLIRDKVFPLFKEFPLVDNYLLYKGHYRNALQLLKLIKAKQYDICISFHDSDPCPIEVSYLAGIKFIYRIALKDQSTAKYLTSRIPYDENKHYIHQRLDILRYLFDVPLNSKEDLRIDLPIKRDKIGQVWSDISKDCDIDLNNKRLIGFNFSASSLFKEWPLENFIELGNKILTTNKDAVLVILGSPKDSKRAKKIISNIKFPYRTVDLAGKTTLANLPYVIAGLDCLVTNDTGPLHIAISVQTKTVSLFVPSLPKNSGPIQDLMLHKVISKPRPCNPCVGKYCKNPNCMELIKVDEVYEAINSLI